MKFKIINLLIITGLILPSFCFTQGQATPMPETIEEAKSFGIGILKKIPEAVERVWQEEALPLWQRMWSWWVQGPWNTYIWPKIEWLGEKVKVLWYQFLEFLGKEVERRKPELKEEWQKEKEEMKEEIPKIKESLWERFKQLLD